MSSFYTTLQTNKINAVNQVTFKNITFRHYISGFSVDSVSTTTVITPGGRRDISWKKLPTQSCAYWRKTVKISHKRCKQSPGSRRQSRHPGKHSLFHDLPTFAAENSDAVLHGWQTLAVSRSCLRRRKLGYRPPWHHLPRHSNKSIPTAVPGEFCSLEAGPKFDTLQPRSRTKVTRFIFPATKQRSSSYRPDGRFTGPRPVNVAHGRT